MADESNRPRAPAGKNPDGGKPLVRSEGPHQVAARIAQRFRNAGQLDEEPHQVAARIAQKLREAGHRIVIVDPLPTKPSSHRWDSLVISVALILLTTVAWAYLFWLWATMDMGGMDMNGFRIIPSGMGYMMPVQTPWRAMEFFFVLAMWTVMRVAMMTASTAPMIFMYAHMGRLTEKQGTLSATTWFVAGYFLAWTAFALLATFAQWTLERSGMLDTAMASTNEVLGGFVFLVAGSYQWTAAKDKCLVECQRPFEFLTRHGGFRYDAQGSVLLGLRHGAYCVGCCWLLMALLFVGGVMNLLWIVLLAVFIFLEKVTSSFGRFVAPIAGTLLMVAGTWMIMLATEVRVH
jgi:predicted metal-binding membrane protein